MEFMKKLGKTLLIGASALALVACGNGGSETADSGSADSEGKTNLTFWHAMGGGAGEALQELVDDYNASQDEVFVETQYQGTYDDTLTKLRSSAAGSEVDADIVQVYEQGTAFMIDSGLTAPVQDYVDSSDFDTSVLEENLLAYYTINGTLHSMPFNSSTPILYYNQDLFDAAGIQEAPTTLTEVQEIAPDLEAAGADMAISTGIYGWYIEQWINKTGEDLFNNGNGRDEHPTQVVFDENGSMLKALETWKTLQDEGVMPNVGREGGQPEFVSGASAMTVASTASLQQILSEVDGRFEVGTAFYPALDEEDTAGVSIGGASLWMIDSGDQARMDATWDFITYLVSPEVQAKWNASTGYFPVNTDAHETETFQQNIQENPQFQTAIDQLHAATPEDQGAISGVNQEARTYYEAELEKLLNDSQSAQEAVDNMASQVNAALESYNAGSN